MTTLAGGGLYTMASESSSARMRQRFGISCAVSPAVGVTFVGARALAITLGVPFEIRREAIDIRQSIATPSEVPLPSRNTREVYSGREPRFPVPTVEAAGFGVDCNHTVCNDGPRTQTSQGSGLCVDEGAECPAQCLVTAAQH